MQFAIPNLACLLVCLQYQLNGDVTAGTNGSIARKDLMQDRDIHIHFPAGAVGKDGPSAGITILVVLISLLRLGSMQYVCVTLSNVVDLTGTFNSCSV